MGESPSLAGGIGGVLRDATILAAVRARPQGGQVVSWDMSDTGHIVGFAPLPGDVRGRATVFVALERGPALAAANRRTIRSLAATGAGVLAAVALGWFMARRSVLEPIRRIAETAEAFGRGQLARRVPIHALGAPELRALGSTFNDMAEKMLSRRMDLARSEELHRLLTETVSDVVMLLDQHFHRLYVSPASRRLSGYEPEQLVGSGPLPLLPPDSEPFAGLARQALALGDPGLGLTIACVRRDGTPIWAELRASRLNGARGYVATLRDVTESREAERELIAANRQLEAIAGQDSLTGLANRRRFDELLAQAWRRSETETEALALLLVDVDRFKAFNDLYGHQAGDACLRRVSAALLEVVRRSEDVVARYGGEEFALLLPATEAQEAAAIANRVRLAVHAAGIPHEGSDGGVLTVSVGVAAIAQVQPGDDVSGLIWRADTALYAAKRGGRDRVQVGQELPNPAGPC